MKPIGRWMNVSMAILSLVFGVSLLRAVDSPEIGDQQISVDDIIREFVDKETAFAEPPLISFFDFGGSFLGSSKKTHQYRLSKIFC